MDNPFQGRTASPAKRAMGEKRALNPVEAHRRSQKRKQQEKKRAVRQELLSRLPLARRDPSKLLAEITRLREMELAGRLDGSGRMKRNHLEEQFAALNKAREKVALPTLLLPDFDPTTPPNAVPANKKIREQSRTEAPRRIVYGDRDCLDLPMPSGPPLPEGGIAALSPYLPGPLDASLEAKATTVDLQEPHEMTPVPVITAEPTRQITTDLDIRVDAFLKDLDV